MRYEVIELSSFTPYPYKSDINFLQANSGEAQSIWVLLYKASLSFFASDLESAMIQYES